MTNRRQFLQTAAAVSAASTPYFFSSPRTLADEMKSKNDRMSIGVIGCGVISNQNIAACGEWVDLAAIAEVDSGRAAKYNQEHAGGKADIYEDYRSILDRDDIDIVHVATPDHWHAKPLIEAMLAGKDVYCEKPLTLTIDEGKLVRKIQKQTGRIVQVGTQQRSTFDLFVKAMAIVADGRLGRIHHVQAAINGGPKSASIPVADVPEGLNWDRWLGPAPAVDYRFLEKGKRGQSNCHYEFRWWYEYSGGKLTDWGAHHVDIATWALNLNGQNEGPISVGGTATHPVDFKDGYPVQKDRYNTAINFKFDVLFPGGTRLTIRDDTDRGVLIEGDKGRIFVNRGKLVGAPVDQLVDNPLPEDAISKVYKNLPIQFSGRRGHWANFLHCVREQVEPISDVHSHMKMLNICHLAGISARTGRDLKWDNTAEEIVGDDAANAMLRRENRSGYEIEMEPAVAQG